MGPALPQGDRVRIVEWNFNSLGDYSNQVGFVSKIRKIYGDIFVLCDTRFGLADEAPFKKVWGEPFLFNSHSSDKRGLAVIIKKEPLLRK